MCNICLLNIWPLTVTLTLSWHMGNMGSAHPLVEMNVSFKFEWNPSISKGVIERTRIGDGPTDRPTRQSESSIAPPPTFCGGGIINRLWIFRNGRSDIMLIEYVNINFCLVTKSHANTIKINNQPFGTRVSDNVDHLFLKHHHLVT